MDQGRNRTDLTSHPAQAGTAEADRVRRVYRRAAADYDTKMGGSEQFLFGDGRAWVASRARGDVLEIAVGTGRNLPFYPPEVRLTGVDLSPEMLDQAAARARSIGRAIDLRVGDAEALEFADASFNSVVITLGLCTIPHPRTAVAEARRVLRPGGRLLLLEHVRSPIWPVAALQYLLNPLFLATMADHLVREPLDHIRAEGLMVEELERHRWGVVERLAARKPGAG